MKARRNNTRKLSVKKLLSISEETALCMIFAVVFGFVVLLVLEAVLDTVAPELVFTQCCLSYVSVANYRGIIRSHLLSPHRFSRTTFASQTGFDISLIFSRFFIHLIFPCSLYFVVLGRHHVW
jgi:hypothetical protein